MIKIGDVRQLTTIFYNVLKENEHLRNFKNTISIGKFNKQIYIPLYKILIKKNPDENMNATDIHMLNTSKIRIINFSIFNLVKILEANNSNYESHNSHIEYLNIFGRKVFANQTYHNSAKPCSTVGLNVDRNLKMKGALLSFIDVRTLIEGISDFNYLNNELYYVGKKNVLLAVSAPNGTLIIREQTLLNLLKYNSAEETKLVLKKLLTAYSEIYEKFENINIREISDQCYSLSVFNARNALTRELSLFRNTGKMTDDQFSKIEVTMLNKIDQNIKQLFKGTVFGIHNSRSYANIIQEILNKRKDIEETISKKSFSDGMAFGLKIEMLGWRPRAQNFVDEYDHTAMWWEKDVNIIPDTFIYKSERYEIPLKHRSWKITKLFVSLKGIMRCTGNHPNVSGTKVCMGDLQINWVGEYEQLKVSLQNAETLLNIINFDSAYNPAPLKDLLKISKKIEFLSNSNTLTRLNKIKAIKEISFTDSDDTDGEESVSNTPIVKEKGNRIIKTNKNNAEIEVIKTDSKIKKIFKSEDKLYENEEGENFELVPGTSHNTYEVNSDMPSLSYVSHDGTLTPVVRVVEASVSAVIQPVVVNNSSELELTDADIIR